MVLIFDEKNRKMNKMFQKHDVQYVTLVKKCPNEEDASSDPIGPCNKADHASPQQTALLALDVAFRVLRCAESAELVDRGVPSRIVVETTADLNELVKFLGVAKFFDGHMITSLQDTFLFNHLREIMLLCNDRMQDFVKKRCKTVEQVLKIFQDVGDDGRYEWIPRKLIRPLFLHFKSGDKGEAAMDKLTPEFLVFLFKHPLIIVKTNVQGYFVWEENHAFDRPSHPLHPLKRRRDPLGAPSRL